MLCQNLIGGFKWLDPAKFNLHKYENNNLRDSILEVHLEYPKELNELHNDYPLAPDKLKIKREMLLDHQLKIADDYISNGNVKKINFYLIRQKLYAFHYKNLQFYLRIRLKIKKYIMH